MASFENATVTDALDLFRTDLARHLALLGIVLVALGLRAPGLGANSLWIDEMTTLVFAREHTVRELVFEMPMGIDPHPPLYYVIMKWWVDLVGASTVLVRVPSVLFGIGAVYLVYAFGRDVFEPRVGLLAALFLAVAPMHVQYSREARMYALLLFLAIASMYLFVALLERDRSYTLFVGYATVTALLLYVHVYALFVVGAQNALVIHWLLSGRTDIPFGWRDWVSLQAVVSVLAGPWLVALGWQVLYDSPSEIGWLTPPGPTELGTTVLGHTGALVHYPFASYSSLTVALAVIVVATLVILGWVSFVGYRESDGSFSEYIRHQQTLFAWLVVPIAVPFLLSHSLSPIFYPRYTIVGHAAVWLIAAYGVTRVNRSALKWALAGVIVVSLLVSTGAFATTGTQEDWRGAGDRIDERPDAVVFVTPEYTTEVVNYYSDRPVELIETPPQDAVASANDPLAESNDTVAYTEQALEESAADDYFYVVTLAFDRETEWLEDLESNLEVAAHYSTGNIDVYLFAVSDEGYDD